MRGHAGANDICRARLVHERHLRGPARKGRCAEVLDERAGQSVGHSNAGPHFVQRRSLLVVPIHHADQSRAPHAIHLQGAAAAPPAAIERDHDVMPGTGSAEPRDERGNGLLRMSIGGPLDQQRHMARQQQVGEPWTGRQHPRGHRDVPASRAARAASIHSVRTPLPASPRTSMDTTPIVEVSHRTSPIASSTRRGCSTMPSGRERGPGPRCDLTDRAFGQARLERQRV